MLGTTGDVGGHNQKFLACKDNLRLFIPEHSNVKWRELDVSLFCDEELDPENSGTARVRMKFQLPTSGDAPNWQETQALGASGAGWSQAMEGPGQARAAGEQPKQPEVARKQLGRAGQLVQAGPPVALP